MESHGHNLCPNFRIAIPIRNIFSNRDSHGYMPQANLALDRMRF